MLTFSFILLLSLCVCGGQRELKIGGVFDTDQLKTAFNLAVDTLDEYPIRLVQESKIVSESNAFEVIEAVCDLMSQGVVAIFGPTSSYVQPICDRMEIPHVEVHWSDRQHHDSCLLNVHPNPNVLSRVYFELLKSFNWPEFTIMYEDARNLDRLSQILTGFDQREYSIVLRQLEDVDGSFRSTLARMKKSGEKNFVIDCSLETLEQLLRQALEVGLITDGYNYIITNLDLQSLQLDSYKYGGANITGLRMFSPYHSKVKQILRDIEELQDSTFSLKLDSALLIDSIHLLYEALLDLSLSSHLKLNGKQLLCNSSNSWQHGYTIINYMKTKTMEGLTGVIKFDNQGFRSDFTLDVIELGLDGLVQIGSWNTTEGYSIKRDYTVKKLEDEDDDGNLLHKSFVVITCLTPPYGMLKETTVQLSGNNRYEGFCIDLITELSKMLGFNYTFVIQEDGANGNLNRTTGEWNGMIRKIIDGQADLAITDLTITSERESAVDFTMPFMNLGISILYRKPEPVPPSLFMFSSPFSLSVWVSLGVSYFLVSVCFFVMGRLSPSEWTNPFPCIEEPEYLINQFSVRNSLWFTIGSLMQQGSEIAPIGISTRMGAGVWWFFTLIMVSSYTANLAAFLTVETLVTPFKNIDELAEQAEVKYGAKMGGATENFFRDSNVSTYKKVWKYMEKHYDQVMTSSNEEGVERVEKENYAYLMESTSIEYIVERHCALAQVGQLLDDKGYGIAMKKDSPYRNILSQAILKLQETGVITDLKRKWWKEDRGGGNCMRESNAGQPKPLSLQNVGGVFMVLFVGTLLGFCSTFIQLCITTFKMANKDKMSFKQELIKELKFLFNFKQMVKPVKQNSTMIKSDLLTNMN